MTDDEAWELLTARYRHPARRPDPARSSRTRLVEDLKLINRSLEGLGARVDVTAQEAGGRTMDELWTIVAEAADRLIVLLRYG